MAEKNCSTLNGFKSETCAHIRGTYVEKNSERFYKIENYQRMPPFFMSIVSDSDHWMFISSNGALSAGRIDYNNSLFPYYNDDQITDSNEITGSKTVVHVTKNNNPCLWEPFSERTAGLYNIRRNIYKNVWGNKLIFEEINDDLGISFEYGWYTSDRYGFVKRSKITNLSGKKLHVRILDGIQNILPYGITYLLQIQMSTLTNAYKKNELLPDSGIGIYFLSSIPTDKAEPSEGLKATTVWSAGLKHTRKLISSKQLDAFREKREITQEADVKASRGAYFISSSLVLDKNKSKDWYIISEINQDISDIRALEKRILSGDNLIRTIEEDIQRGTENLVKLVAAADGLQATADKLTSGRHFSNVLFNIMRGGIFCDNYNIEKKDLLLHITQANKVVAEQFAAVFHELADTCNFLELIDHVKATGDADLLRICYEYLPLIFSRRHGDPSRPWNMFSIQTKNEDGSQRFYYQGNWRDIFQNWEALCFSFPEFVESTICKFVNASTADGYNPYRISRDGIDWEIQDPGDPWSHIGYWGDHQIIYLLKLLELSHSHNPGKIHTFLGEEIFTYANIPYRIKDYGKLLTDPHHTIDFDDQLEHKLKDAVTRLGEDAKLIFGKDKKVYKVNLTEKLLVPLLAKLSNFIPEAGIWMNTQRPEWNDANNALVGYGVSMVTLYYLRRFLSFCISLFSGMDVRHVNLSEEVDTLFKAIHKTFHTHQGLIKGEISDKDRKNLLDLLGGAASKYRQTIYSAGFSGIKTSVTLSELTDFFNLALTFIDHTIRANKRKDDLYHSYNLMKIVGDGIKIRPLYEMLEGQVAVLSSGYLSAQEAVRVFDALKSSNMYRQDQYSYTLYPDRKLPRFMQKNVIPKDRFQKSRLFKKLIADGDSGIIKRDINGDYHFNGAFRNARELAQALQKLSHSHYKELVQKEGKLILDIFEEIFDHQSFTGRSGTFYGYEGLGCIYWHMVSKLVLALEENYYWALKQNAPRETLDKLVEYYYATRAGIGLNKPPQLYGAFPTDPYSHTPANAGAKQPGMTGQVKEDILSRWGELGLIVKQGCIGFNPALLRTNEFYTQQADVTFYDVHHVPVCLRLAAGSLAYTYAGTPIIYHISTREGIVITRTNGQIKNVSALTLDKETSVDIFTRRGNIARIDVYLKPALK
jgi:hypothetical protein